MLEEMIYNLLDNAVKYNKAGGKAEINISDGDNIVITVKDTSNPKGFPTVMSVTYVFFISLSPLL